ncbi:hypothetical protein AArc1_0631 [Natrarchaeobaculum sulfurireducens]|uniref:Uncharacterized protein n=1 Tax=Natrarchaeobaculum sulfurireducens TaxID=2044521 RepID=A0A346PBT0_9EURY|nr:hypothetical protein AArc1_0631 [Natrarchaeobaculum sulfurireducens]
MNETCPEQRHDSTDSKRRVMDDSRHLLNRGRNSQLPVTTVLSYWIGEKSRTVFGSLSDNTNPVDSGGGVGRCGSVPPERFVSSRCTRK